MVGAESAALSTSRMSNERSTGELRPRGNGVPSWTPTSNLEFRTLPLSTLSYGDVNQPLVGLFHQLTSRGVGSLDLVRFQGFQMAYQAVARQAKVGARVR